MTPLQALLGIDLPVIQAPMAGSQLGGLAVGDFSPLWSGQNASGCREVPAAQLTRDLAANL